MLENLGIEGVEEEELEEVRKLTYKDILCKIEGEVLSLDISVRGTGWVKIEKGEIRSGVYKLSSKSDVERRYEFKRMLEEICGEVEYEYILVEDVIRSGNFKTGKILMQLNPLIDDMVYEGKVRSKGGVIRVGNKEWKKWLKSISNYKSKVRKEEDKEVVKGSLKELGYENESQDIADAMGMLIGYVSRKIKGEKVIYRGESKDILRGYQIKQYKEEEKAERYIERYKKGKKLKELDYRLKSRDIRYNFKKEKVKEESEGEEVGVYKIRIKGEQLGVLGVEKKLEMKIGEEYILVVSRKK